MADIGTIVERLFRETGLAGLPFYVGGAAVVEVDFAFNINNIDKCVRFPF